MARDPGLRREDRYQAGLRHLEAGRLSSAETCLRAFATANPASAVAHYQLGVVLRAQGRLRPSLHAFSAAARLEPAMAHAHAAVGATLSRLSELEAAEPSLRRAIALDPGLVFAHVALGSLLRQAGRLSEAGEAFDAALKLDPTAAEARFGRAFLKALRGDLAGAWPDYEFREARRTMADPALQPQWRGASPEGKTVLVYGEQGLGDTLQFLRYAEPLARRGARVLAATPIPLMRLAASAPGVHAVVEPGPTLPPFDACCPLASLPLYFGTDLGSVPAPARYLAPPMERVDHWRTRLGATERLTVAFAWAGAPGHPNDHNRSTALADWAPLLALEGVRWIAVQKGEAAASLRRVRTGVDVLGLGDALNDMADTAAVLDLADLVISIDSAPCHLAGALGRRTWTLLPFAPDWRWMLKRTDSPWYPSMRLYRQDRPGDWAGVLQRVADDLCALVAARRGA